MARNIADATVHSVGGLPGDISAECLSGLSGGNPISACGWASDKTLALFISLTQNTGATQLATLMKKMRPDLVQG